MVKWFSRCFSTCQILPLLKLGWCIQTGRWIKRGRAAEYGGSATSRRRFHDLFPDVGRRREQRAEIAENSSRACNSIAVKASHLQLAPFMGRCSPLQLKRRFGLLHLLRTAVKNVSLAPPWHLQRTSMGSFVICGQTATLHFVSHGHLICLLGFYRYRPCPQRLKPVPAFSASCDQRGRGQGRTAPVA